MLVNSYCKGDSNLEGVVRTQLLVRDMKTIYRITSAAPDQETNDRVFTAMEGIRYYSDFIKSFEIYLDGMSAKPSHDAVMRGYSKAFSKASDTMLAQAKRLHKITGVLPMVDGSEVTPEEYVKYVTDIRRKPRRYSVASKENLRWLVSNDPDVFLNNMREQSLRLTETKKYNKEEVLRMARYLSVSAENQISLPPEVAEALPHQIALSAAIVKTNHQDYLEGIDLMIDSLNAELKKGTVMPEAFGDALTEALELIEKTQLKFQPYAYALLQADKAYSNADFLIRIAGKVEVTFSQGHPVYDKVESLNKRFSELRRNYKLDLTPLEPVSQS